MSAAETLTQPAWRATADLLGQLPVGDGAPRELGSNVMIGCPNDGASDSRTVRGTTLRQTMSPKWSRTSAADLVGQLGPGVVHDEHDGADLQRRVQVLLDQVDVAQELTESFERVVLALDRHQDLGGRRQGVDRQQPERGRAVDEDVVVVVEHLVDGSLEPQLAAERRHQLDLGAGQVEAGRGHEELRVPPSASMQSSRGTSLQQDVVHRRLAASGG